MPDEQDEALGRLARVLTGDDRRAAELLGEVAVLAGGSTHQRDDGHEDRRGLLVQRVLRQRRRPAADPAPQPGPDLRPADLTSRLGRLDPLGRTLLVLRHAEHVTLAELARVTDRSPAAVARALEQAETRAAAEPYEIEQALWAAAAPEPGAVREAARRFAGRRRRHRGRVALAGALAVGLVAAATVLPGLLREQPYTRAYGEWTTTAHLVPPGPFTVRGLQLSAGEEVLGVVSAADPDSTCSLTVTTTLKQVTVPAGRQAIVADRPARFVEATALTDAGLWWSVGPKTSALAQCDDRPEDQTLLDLAGQVQFAQTPIRVPYDLRGLPHEDEVQSYLEFAETSGILVTPRGGNEESPGAVFVGLAAESSASAVSGRRVDIDGSPGRLTDDEDETTACWPAGVHTVCATLLGPGDLGGRSERSRRTDRVLQTARAVRLAPDLDERATWFDAQDALPR